MKIIPIQTSDLRSILLTKKKYSELYAKYETAYQNDTVPMPVSWYDKFVKEKTKINAIGDDQDLIDYIDQLIESKDSIDILTLTKKSIERFGEIYWMMRPLDWFRVIRTYVEYNKVNITFNQDEYASWMAADNHTV